MELLELPIDLFEMIVEDLVDLSPIPVMLNVRLVNKLLNGMILQCMFARITHYRMMRRFLERPPFLGKFICSRLDVPCVAGSKLFSAMSKAIGKIEEFKAKSEPSEELSSTQRRTYLEALSKAAAYNLDLVTTIKFLSIEEPETVPDESEDPLLGALIAVAAEGDIELVRKFLDLGADLDLRSTYFASPLVAAITNGHEDIVALLLERGSDLRQLFIYRGKYTNNYRLCTSPLWLACRGRHLKIAELLLRPEHYSSLLGSGSEESGVFPWTSMQEAVRTGMKPLIECIRNSVPENPEERTSQEAISSQLLYKAAKCGDFDLVNSLLEEGVTTANYDFMAQAVDSGNHAVVRLLIEKGHTFDQRCLRRAASNGDQEMVSFILETGIDINDESDVDGNPRENFSDIAPIYSAVRAGRDDMARFLVERGAKVDATGRGAKMLHRACVLGRNASARILVNLGVDPNVTVASNQHALVYFNEEPYPPVAMALLHGSGGPADILIKLGAKELDPAMKADVLQRKAERRALDREPAFRHQPIVQQAASVLELQRKWNGWNHYLLAKNQL